MTNTNNLTTQLIAQGVKASAKQPASNKLAPPEKSFKDVMRQKVEQPKATEPKQNKPTAYTEGSAQGQTAEEPTKLTEVSAVSNGLIQNESQAKRSFLASMFGITAVDGVDMEQSDMDILRDVYNNVNDPVAQFALMLMMAFLEANPDKSISDFEQQMGTDLLENPDVSPVQKVFSAIARISAGDPDVKSSDLLDQLMQIARNGSTTKRPVISENLFRELEAQIISGGQTQPKEQTTTAQQLSAKDSMPQLRFDETVAQARQLMQKQAGQKADTNGTGEKRESGVKLDVDKLQEQVDAGSFLRNTAHASFRLEQAGALKAPMPVDTADLVNQVKTGMLSGLEKGSNEFVLKLRPEGLGELTIHLVESGAKTTLSIVASSVQTQKLLTGELANLQAAMKPLQVEVQPVTTSQEASTADQNLFGQSAQQQFGEHNHNGQFARHSAQRSWQETEEQEDTIPMSYTRTDGTSALDAYI